MNMNELAGTDLGSATLHVDDRTAILYALCTGASGDDLDLVWERDLRVLPSLGTAVGLWAVERAGDLGAYDRARSLHAGQSLVVHRPIPVNGDLHMTARVGSVVDKGKAAIVEILVESEAFSAAYTIFLPGMGGFGGDAGATPAALEPFTPDHETVVHTSDRLALFYRLTGDRHPIHVDPGTARANGFDVPILHGLCTLGIAARAVAGTASVHPADLTLLSARLAAPVFPGQSIVVRSAVTGDGVRFEASAGDALVLRDGVARFGR